MFCVITGREPRPCGPEEEMEYRESPENWNKKSDSLVEHIKLDGDPKGPWSENIPLYFAWVKVADAFETARRKLEELTGTMKESELLSDYAPFVDARSELRWFTTRLGRAFPSLKQRTHTNRKTGGVDSAGGARRP